MTRLHPSYALGWTVIQGIQLLFLVFRPPLWALWIHLALFGILEGIAVYRHHGGDTLSEWQQSISGKLPDTIEWWRSWKAVVVLFAALWSLEGGYVVSRAWGWPVGVLVGVGVFLWLSYHWVRTSKYR